jgi:hypothetical protein
VLSLKLLPIVKLKRIKRAQIHATIILFLDFKRPISMPKQIPIKVKEKAEKPRVILRVISAFEEMYFFVLGVTLSLISSILVGKLIGFREKPVVFMYFDRLDAVVIIFFWFSSISESKSGSCSGAKKEIIDILSPVKVSFFNFIFFADIKLLIAPALSFSDAIFAAKELLLTFSISTFGKLFFKDLSEDIIQDDDIQRLTSFPNMLLTAHQAFFTNEALTQIALTTFRNVSDLIIKKDIDNKVALLN